MPKLLNSQPKCRRHKASGQAIVTLDCQDFYLGPHGSKISMSEYDRLVAEWLANGRRIPQTDKASVSIEELLAAFWGHAQRHYVGLDGKPTQELKSFRYAMKPLRALSLCANIPETNTSSFMVHPFKRRRALPVPAVVHGNDLLGRCLASSFRLLNRFNIRLRLQ